ncbi:MAG TPA: polysaccharide biosynthesis tyrosine autokinase [Flavipsychrobacter sp.]|nr:polysaccharide biosynthesis tyrosine autokinase [Flavipsychrobacter sp.]
MSNEIKEQSVEASIQKWVGMILSYWPWLIGSVLVTLFIANVYLRYSTPMYHIRAKVLIQDDKKSSGMSEADFLEDLGLGGKSNVDNEIEIFKSRYLMQRVVRDLQLNIRYFTKGRFKTLEAYEPKPFTFTLLRSANDTFRESYANYELEKVKDGFILFDGSKYWKGKWGTVLTLSIGRAFIDANSSVSWPEGQKFIIAASNVEDVAMGYLSSLDVALVNKQVSMINLMFNDAIPKRGEIVLNKLVDVYIRANVDDKNRIADSTMTFIDERLKVVGEELRGVERDKQDFMEANNVTDINAQSSMLLQSSNDYAGQLTQQQVQLNVVESIEKYIVDNNRRVIPANLTAIQNPTFTSLIDKYNALQLERERTLMTTTENNPIIQSMDNQLDNLRQDVKNNLASAKSNIQIGINQLRSRAGNIDAQIRSAPGKERVFIDISRQQNIKQELYLFLLKKREECAITKSATIANARVVDPAKADGMAFSPNRSKTYMNAFLLGLFLPILGIFLKEQLNTKLIKKSDITARTKTPIIAEVGHNLGEKSVLVEAGSKNVLAEQFRNLRTNLQFLLPNPNEKVILLTSTMSGEGKSFIASNLASTLAISNKKVLLIELDLRKPKISKIFNITSPLGFSNYIIGQAELKDVIIPSGVHDSLFILPSGPIPPNPAELLMTNRMSSMIKELRQHFDYIIVDTAPVGLVTDAQILGGYVDATLYVVRQEYTFKQQIGLIDDLYKGKKLPSMCVVVNDVKSAKNAYGYGYGYGYGYSYGYGYGDYSNGYFEGAEGKGLKGFINRTRKKLGV